MRIHAAITAICFLFLSTIAYGQSADSSGIFSKVDKEAAFPDGETAWKKFLERNLNPNVPVDNGAPMGLYTVIVQFVVDKNGLVSDIRPLTSNGYGMEQEVVRILRKGGKWESALLDGQPVNAYRK